MSGHPCGTCLRWPECNGVAWGTPDCPASPAPDPLPTYPKIDPAMFEEKTESGILEE